MTSGHLGNYTTLTDVTVGGAPASKHMQGTAFDIAMANHDPVAFAEAARAVGFLGFGTYPRSGFMHIDLGPARSWGDPFPARPVMTWRVGRIPGCEAFGANAFRCLRLQLF